MTTEWGAEYGTLRWVTPEQAAEATHARERLLVRLAPAVAVTCHGTKLSTGPLSPGCRSCTRGDWSCLFVTGRCNCRCFYCPAPQDRDSLPATNALTFEHPRDYAAYINAFGFQGVSISGGEPLLTPDRTLAFLDVVRDRCGSHVHTWLYTNGTLLTEALVRRLAAAGLQEIRFDIGAVGYALDRVALACGRVPCVTVEIPAVPEDYPLVRDLLGRLSELGVSHLNLHQLRLTPHNLPRLAGREYTFIPGEHPTVLESEFCALQLMESATVSGASLAVHYCSFVYKNRHQRAAARTRAATGRLRTVETLTERGVIRVIRFLPADGDLAGAAAFMASAPVPDQVLAWRRAGSAGAMEVSEAAARVLLDLPGRWQVGYADPGLRDSVTYRFPFEAVDLASGRRVYLERRPVAAVQEVEPDVVRALCAGDAPGVLAEWERIPEGLQAYA